MNPILFAGTNARAARMTDGALPRHVPTPVCDICGAPGKVQDAFPYLNDGKCCAACFEAHVLPVRLREIGRRS